MLVTLLEMAFAGHCGLRVHARSAATRRRIAQLFAEEPGAVLQVLQSQQQAASWTVCASHGLADCVQLIGAPIAEMRVRIRMRCGAAG